VKLYASEDEIKLLKQQTSWYELLQQKVDNVSKKSDDLWLRWSALLHDIGKPEAFTPIDQKFISHEIIGYIALKENLHQLTFSSDEITKICGLTKLHMNSIQKMTPKAIRKLLKKFNDEGVDVKDFLRLRMADRKANLSRENFTISEWKEMYKILMTEIKSDIPMNTHKLAIQGGDLIRELNLKPGPIISDIQKCLLCFVIEGGGDLYNDYDLLLEVAKSFL